MRDQAVTDGQQGIELAGFSDRQVVLGDTDDQTTDQVDQQNQQTGHGVTAHEFRGAVHRTEEVRFLGQFGAAFFGGLLVDHAGVQVGVDRHLFAWHGIQGKTGVHFRDAACTFGHHNKVNDHQNREDDETDHIVAGDHKFAESRHHFACRMGAFMAMDQDDTGRRHVERQAQHGGK